MIIYECFRASNFIKAKREIRLKRQNQEKNKIYKANIDYKKTYINKRKTQNEELMEYGRTLDFNELALIKNIKKVDKGFNERLFLKMSHDIAKELIKTKIVKNESAKFLYQAINKNVLQIESPNYFSFDKSKNYYTLKLRVNQKMAMYNLNPIDGDIEYIDKENISNTSYEMTFLKPLNDKEKTFKCPRCGAPLEKNSYYVCRYCFRFIDGGNRKEIKSKISKISYDIPKIELEKILPENCMSCGAPLKKESRGHCEYCKSNNNPDDNKWTLIQFEKIQDN